MKRQISVVPLIVSLGLTLSPLVADAYKYNKPGQPISTSTTLSWGNWKFSNPNGNARRKKRAITRVIGPHHPILEGNSALRFEARFGDCATEECGSKQNRSEVWLSGPSGSLEKQGAKMWYSWNIFIPPGKRYRPVTNPMVGQWHHDDCEPTVNLRWEYSDDLQSHVLLLQNSAIASVTDEDLYFHDYEESILKRNMQIAKERWVSIKFYIHWSRNSDGWIRFWIDHRHQLTFRGPTLFERESCGNVYFKGGVFRTNKGKPTLVMYWDNFKAGRTKSEMQTSFHPFWQDSDCLDKPLNKDCRLVTHTGDDDDPWPGYVGEKVNPGIVVTRPAGGEAWKKGKRYLIKWSKGDAGKYVKLELYRNAKRYRTITRKTRNDGAFKWKIPASVLTRDKYQVRVTSTSSKKHYYLSDGFFTIK